MTALSSTHTRSAEVPAVPIDSRSVLLYSEKAPLTPGPGLRDARAAWCRVPENPDGTALLYLHGHNNYVTVGADGRSRVPDWALSDAARRGAAAKPAAPLAYGLDRLDATARGRRPIVFVPEVAVESTGNFWAREPKGQYADPGALGSLVEDLLAELRRTAKPGGEAYLPKGASDGGGPLRAASLRRLCLAGHSGAGLPLEEAAVSRLVLPADGVPTDLCLLDSTYWSEVSGFVRFCREWSQAGRLGGSGRAARLLCIYRPNTQTEPIADALRAQVAREIGVDAASLRVDHTAENLESAVLPALRTARALFIRTPVPHDAIPTEFIPHILTTAPL